VLANLGLLGTIRGSTALMQQALAKLPDNLSHVGSVFLDHPPRPIQA
jgi:hypothetical protein